MKELLAYCCLFIEVAMLGVLSPHAKARPKTLVAQVVPDTSLEAESSIWVPNGRDINEQKTVNLIEGGAVRGNHLFHSFSGLNVGLDQRLYFLPSFALYATAGIEGEAGDILVEATGNITASQTTVDVSVPSLQTYVTLELQGSARLRVSY